MKYWEIVYARLKKTGKITNSEIIDLTNTNCPHDVIRCLKKHGAEFRVEDKTDTNGKKYREYYLIKPITIEQVKAEPPKEDFTTASQLNFGLIIEKTKMSNLEMRMKYNV